MGQNYTDSFSEYISEKVHFKPGEKIGNKECPDLVYDDLTPYYNLSKELNKIGNYSELTLFTIICHQMTLAWEELLHIYHTMGNDYLLRL